MRLRGADGTDMAGVRVVDQRARTVDAVCAGIGVTQLQVAAAQSTGRGQGDAGDVGTVQYTGKGRQQGRGGMRWVFIAGELY